MAKNASASSVAKRRAIEALGILARDEPRLAKIDRYMQGEHDRPYQPDLADDEYRLLAKRSITNITGFIVGAPVQAMYVDSFRRGDPQESETDGQAVDAIQPEWRHWQRSRLDSLQHPIYRAAFGFGQCYVATEKVKRRGETVVLTRGLSPLRTVGVYQHPATDDNPLYALTVNEWPMKYVPTNGEAEQYPGVAYMWDQTDKWEITFGSTTGDDVKVRNMGKHGALECPVTRFAGSIDLEGRCQGIVEPMIPLQDRLNQQVFDLLIDGTYNSFQVRTASGMVPQVRTKPVYEYPDGNGPNFDPTTGRLDYGDIIGAEPDLNEFGQEVPMPVHLNARRLLIADDPETKFGSLPGTPMDGFIAAIKMTMEQISALSQTPPNYMLGEIANLSAEALHSAEQTLLRKVAEFQSAFGESWERVFRIASQLSGDPIGSEDYSGEVVWRDVGGQSLNLVGDSLAKIAQGLGVPEQALWAEIPGMTAQKLAGWKKMADEQDDRFQLAQAQQRAANSLAPQFRAPQQPTGPQRQAQPVNSGT